MNVVKIMGGLGNQLFQYAFGRAIEEGGIKVAYDVSWYTPEREKTRPYCLGKFRTSVPVSLFAKQYTIKETGFDMELLKKDNKSFYGYWQSPMYYSERVVREIDEAYHVKDEFLTDGFKILRAEIDDVNSVSIHVRRGDYVDNPSHLVLPLSYYREAIDFFYNTKENPVFYIFSDDIPWCREYLKGSNLVHLSEWEDFELMRSCKHHIVANSTFSWWPAFFNKKAVVVAPSIWTHDSVHWDMRKILLDNWIKIHVDV